MKGKLVLGRSGAGKTTYCLEEIARCIQDGWDKMLLLLVPNQFSLEMEKNLVLKTKGKGMDIAQVLSFERLSYRVFSLNGKPKEKILDDVGKFALLRKILYANREALRLYGSAYGKDGFIRQLSSIFLEFHKYGVLPEHLDALKEKSSGVQGLLPLKLGDLSLLFKEYKQFMHQQYISTEQNLDLLANTLDEVEALKGCKIWIDGFYRFTAQDYHVIEKLAGIGEELTVSLTMDGSARLSEAIHPYDPFYESKAAAKKLISIFESVQETSPSLIRLKKPKNSGYSPAMKHFEQEYFHYAPKAYPAASGGSKQVLVTQSGQIYEELNDVGAQIVHLVRDLGYRYKEIALCACDLESYEHLLVEAMQGHEIPYFIDSRKSIYYKRLVEVIRSLIQIGVSNWSIESVIRLLRTGVFSLEEEEIDFLENYLLEFGIKSYKWQQERWHFCKSYEPERDALANEIKQKIEKISTRFLSLFSGKGKEASSPTIRQAAEGIYEFIAENRIMDRLLLLEENPKDIVQIWNILAAMFDKIVEIMGSEPTDIKLFSQIVEGALESASEGFIPARLDAVTLGDVRRTRLPEIKVLFIVGMNDGVIPSQKGDEGILTDAERMLLAEADIELGPSGVRRIMEEQLLLYAALTKPKERLYVSYPTMGLDNGELRKSVVIDKIQQIFPGCLRWNSNKDSNYFTSKTMLIRGLSRQLERLQGEDSVEHWWKSGFGWAAVNAPEALEQMLDGTFGNRRYKSISPKNIKRYLQKDIKSSVTRIERFIACPFSYFAEYGLRARERQIYGLRPIDMGNIYHSTLEEISKKIQQGQMDWKDIGSPQGHILVDETVDKICAEMEIFQSSEKNKYLSRRVKRVARRAVWALSYQMRKGSFVPKEYEVSFGEGENSLPPIVVELKEGYRFVFRGRIDRVDVYDKDGKKYVKVIDYKSGKKKFNLQEVYYGLQIQLTRYLAAYLENDDNCRPAGMFYFRVTDPVVAAPETAGDDEAMEQITEEILEALQLSGLVAEDQDIIEAMHNGLAGKSNIIPVTLKKNGEPYKSSSTATMEQFYGLLKRTEEVIREAGNRMISGDIEARPVRGVGGSPCEYCNYPSICGFDADKGYRYRRLKGHSVENILAMLEDNDEDKSN